MKLIRWLLSNIILIAFILALTYAYVYWDNLTGPDTPAGKVIAVLTEEFESVREFVESYQPDTTIVEQGPEQSVAQVSDESDESADAALAASSTSTPPVASAAPQPQSQAQPQSQEQPQPQPQPQQARPPLLAPAPPARQPAPVMARSKPVARTLPDEASRKLWIEARTAFQKGQYKESIGLYKDLVAANNDNFDAWGEMGNVYLRTGDTGQAGAAYYEAAVIMVRLGQLARARSVLPLLHQLDREKARQLNELILNPGARGGV